MKRGFLNTDKAKRKLEATEDSNLPQDDSNRKDKGKEKEKEKAELPPGGRIFRVADGLDLHSVPPSVKSKEQKRFIFLYWPRDPKGKIIKPSEIHGKEAGNGVQFWGATLYDFYFVRRMPDNDHFLTISTGSKLTKVMKEFGELDHAADQISLAAREPEPVEILAWDPAQAITAHERRIFARFCTPKQTANTPEPIEQADMQGIDSDATGGTKNPVSDCVQEGKSESVNSADEANTQSKQIPSDVSVESPFHPSHYPPPWPLVPFENPSPYPLQRRIPIHLLPKKLYVHDPWKLANTAWHHHDLEGGDRSWSSKSDHVRTYTLSLPCRSQEMVEDTARMAAIAEGILVETREGVIIPPQQETEGPTEQPAIRAFLPKRPRKPTEVPEAHLYISPAAQLGNGNHSVVYEAELELPRDLFCERTYCQTCLDEQIDVEVNRLKESGEWDRLLNEHATKKADLSAHDSSSSSSSSVQLPPRHVGFVSVKDECQPLETVSLTTDPMAKDDGPNHLLSDPVINRSITYEGLAIPVYPNIQWQTPSLPDTICKHQAEKMKPVPQTARFRVAAKLSLPYDPHLKREAHNYLEFPGHFFEHWSGYNVVPPIHDPTPVGAVVPQFFGYYEPEEPSTMKDGFLSPILLVEHCGRPISIQELSIDDRHECAALLFRFHYAGWLHESFAERNILMQKGHPTCSPLEETDDPYYRHREHSFRLIDFGRSVKRGGKVGASAVEEMNGKKLFGIMEFAGMPEF
ncbi:hypothetical protein JVU11DRAFT_11792 [Chiua virens]|nr:hypothetical protein JVU11DRAFT_11792 [Chiua virens]